MSFPGSSYAPPGVFTQTKFENPLGTTLESLKIPVFIGEGNEILTQQDLEVVRGSSSTVDQRRVKEDETGHAVISISAAGAVTIGSFDGVLDKFQVRLFPIVTGDGTGTATVSRSDVAVTINGMPIVVRSVDGVRGIVRLAQAPGPNDVVLCTYYFKRTDTLVTDDVSEQVDPDPAIVRGLKGIYDADSPGSIGGAEVLDLHGDITDSQGNVVVESNNVLSLTIDGTDYTIVIPPRTNYKMAQIAAAITASRSGTLRGSTFVNNYGQSTLLLTADHSIVVNNGSGNASIGLLSGQASTRVATFYTFQGPIVDGRNGGVTTTDPAHVTVKVNGRQVIPVSVNGSTRAVTLPQAPKAGAKVAITYYFNAWQDTFDYLAHVGVTSVSRCGETPGGSGFIQNADFILQDDKILWGTAVSVASGVNTQGSEFFDDTQVTMSLIDNQTFLSACTAVTTSSGGASVASKREFQLPFDPTTGNGRNTPLGQSLFQTVSNGRIDLPTNRPDVVKAYWGFDVQDALERGAVQVTKVEGNVITLDESVPVGAHVYASFYYNMLVDNTYTLTCINPGLSGVGTYSITDTGDNDVYGAFIATGSKGTSLLGLTLEFPSGSELTPDLRYEGMSGNDFVGPTDEIVTVQFASQMASPGRFTFPGEGPYEFIQGYSDHLCMTVRSVDTPSTAGLSLADPSGYGCGFFASLVSDEIQYTGGAGAVVGESYDVLVPEEVVLTVDGVDVEVMTPTAAGVDIGFFSDAINEGAVGHRANASGGGVASITLNSVRRSNVDNYYVGWKVVIGQGAAAATPGQAGIITAYNGTTGVATVSGNWAGGAVQAADPYVVYNPASRAVMKGATNFDGPVTLAAGKHDSIRILYTGLSSGALAADAVLAAGAYATPVALATEVQTKLQSAINTAILGSLPHSGLKIEVTADTDGKLVFTFQRPGLDAYGFIQFRTAATAAADFAVLAGIDTGSAVGRGQAALVQGPIARTYEVPASGAQKPYDRLVLRNSLLPGGAGSLSYHAVAAQTGLEVKAVVSDANTGISKTGLASGDYGLAAGNAVTQAASVLGRVGFAGGMNTNAEPLVTFYDGSGVTSANDEFPFEIDGVPVTVTFTGSANGTATPLGPVSGTSNGSVLDQIIDAIAAVPGAPFGNAATIFAAGIVRQEGAGIRLTSLLADTSSRITIGSGSATSILGFSSGAVSLRTLVDAKVAAAALMAHRNTASFSGWMFDVSGGLTSLFAHVALASTQTDAAGKVYLYVQDAPVVVGNLGASSSIAVQDTFQSIANALRFNTGLNATSGDGGVGEASLDGFFVISNTPSGSGSINTSRLNDGVGQDGTVGQTYRDEVTGLTFTLLPRGWGSNPNGPWVSYPTGSNATFRINAGKTFTCNANIPHNAVPGLELKVANTSSVGVGDTAVVTTFERGGNEPAIGDLYYVTYNYVKQDFTTSFYTKLSAVEAAFGTATSDNPVSLAAYLAMLNGAVLVGIKQVRKEPGSDQASLTSYRSAIEELEGVLPGMVRPDIITPLRGDSTSLYQILARSCEIQSSIRYRAERTAIVGTSAGTTPEQAATMARTISDTRLRLVYPDMEVITFQDNYGNSREELVDGTYIAAALAGSIVSPNVDVATPWTGRRLVGFTQLGRTLDAVQQNQVAVAGVTVMEDRPPYLRVRHGLSTDMTNILTKTPTVIMIADEVQRQARVVLDNFVGIKFLSGVLSQVEGRLAMMLKGLVEAKVISAYTGVKANVSGDDPTVAEVEAWYSPVFPLLYLVITFHLRSSL